MLILFDNGTPRGLARFLYRSFVEEARTRGWEELANRRPDRRGPSKQVSRSWSRRTRISGISRNLEARRIALIVLEAFPMAHGETVAEEIVVAVNAAQPGSYVEVAVPFKEVSILWKSRRLNGCWPSKGLIAIDEKQKQPNGTTLANNGCGETKATTGGILPEFSKFDCLPGRAGGTPDWTRTQRAARPLPAAPPSCSCPDRSSECSLLVHSRTSSRATGVYLVVELHSAPLTMVPSSRAQRLAEACFSSA